MHSELEAFAGSTDEVHNHDALDEIASGIGSAHRAYMRQTGRTVDANLGIAMIVQPGERNFADQCLLQFQLWQNYRVRCYRITLAEMHDRGRVQSNGTQDELVIDGVCISVVYFRAGYSPDDHPTEKEWDARLLIEKSFAVKCPTIAYHLAGCKKIQQVLADPGVLERFVPSAAHREELRSVFAGLYSLSAVPDSPAAAALTALRLKVVAAHGENYVMKPQREGGGNNIYGADVVAALQSMTVEEQSAYILMERILPPSAPSKLLRNNQLTEVNLYSLSYRF
jgi:glutathione synthase